MSLSISTVCLTGMMVWIPVGPEGGPSAVATLALEEKECVRDSEGIQWVARTRSAPNTLEKEAAELSGH